MAKEITCHMRLSQGVGSLQDMGSHQLHNINRRSVESANAEEGAISRIPHKGGVCHRWGPGVGTPGSRMI